MTAPVLKLRRTQEERSASTRARLLEATVDCLLERGYAGTTTTEIAGRAGLSRGAQLHHFPTKAELVITAVEYLADRRHAEFVEAFARLPAGADRAGAAIDLLWPILSGPTLYAWLELVVAARTDPELRQSVTAAAGRVIDKVVQTFRTLFPAAESGVLPPDLPPKFAFALMNGMALEKILKPDDPDLPRLLDVLKALARLVQVPVARGSEGGS